MNTATDFQELRQIRANVRRSVEALELCWFCQRICECKAFVVDDGPPVSLCRTCLDQTKDERKKGGTDRLWPRGR